MTNKVIAITENDIDKKHYRLADWRGYSSRADAYASMKEQGFTDCTAYYVVRQNCYAIVSPRD